MPNDTLTPPVMHTDPVARLGELFAFMDRLKDERSNVRKSARGTRSASTRAKQSAVHSNREPIDPDSIKKGTWVSVKGTPGLFKVDRVLKNGDVTMYGGVLNEEANRAFTADKVVAADERELAKYLAKRENADVQPRLKAPKKGRKTNTDEEFLD